MLLPIMQKPKESTYVIASPIKGILTNKGLPLANVRIVRKLTWNSGESKFVSDFYTDDNGRFYLPLHEELLKLNALVEFRANQRISVDYDNELDDIWGSSHSGTLYGETGGVEVELMECDLTNDFAAVYGEGISLLSTKCRWKNINMEYDEDE